MATDEFLTSETRLFEIETPRIGADMPVPASDQEPESSRQPVYVIDSLAREVHLGGRRVRLTVREFNLLVYLLGRRGETVSRGEFLRNVWGGAYGGASRTVDVHVQRLRAKLGESLKLRTVRGIGYVLC